MYDRELQRHVYVHSLVRFENKNIFFCFERRSSLLKSWRCNSRPYDWLQNIKSLLTKFRIFGQVVRKV
jgi:hypothetical protein